MLHMLHIFWQKQFFYKCYYNIIN